MRSIKWLRNAVQNKTLAGYLTSALALSLMLSATACGGVSSAYGQEDFLDSPKADDLPDFSYAGYRFGESDIPISTGKVVKAADFGVLPNDNRDDSKALQAALHAAHETDGPVILKLPAGRIIVREILVVARSNITIRGAGSGNEGTEIHFPRPLIDVDKSDKLTELRTYLKKYDKRQKDPAQNIDEYFSEYSWTGGFIWIQKPGTRAASYLEEYDPEITNLSDIVSGQRGSKSLIVDTTAKLQIGDAVQIHWFNREGPDGQILDQIYGDTKLDIGSHHWSFPNRPLVRQTTRIISIRGNEIDIGDPLLHDISKEIPAQFSNWDYLEEVGLEDFRITFPESPYFGHHLERGYNGIYITSVIDGWVRDVQTLNADSGILTYNSANLTLENIRSLGKRPGHYAVHLGNVHNVLVRDLVVDNPVIHSLTFNTQSTKSVYQRAKVYNASVLDQHAGANHQNLFDNVTLHINAERERNTPFYNVWNGSGAGYWQPGHGRFNTTWNLNVVVEGGAERGETVLLKGTAEGPDAFIYGIHGNRNFEVDYRPRPMEISVNDAPEIQSLYDWQLKRRMTNHP